MHPILQIVKLIAQTGLALQITFITWEIIFSFVPTTSPIYLGYLRHLPSWTHVPPGLMFSSLLLLSLFVKLALLPSLPFPSIKAFHLKSKPFWYTATATLLPLYALFTTYSFYGLERFTVPSESMTPTLIPGSTFFAWKSAYKIPTLTPTYGDIVVFNHQEPTDTQPTAWVKRIVGLPGDTLTYTFASRQLTINQFSTTPQPPRPNSPRCSTDQSDAISTANILPNNQSHDVCVSPSSSLSWKTIAAYSSQSTHQVHSTSFLPPPGCTLTDNNNSLSCTVPPRHYFVLGDNRDNSIDSRFFGPIPHSAILGKALFIQR